MPEPGPLRDYSRSRAVLIGAWDYKHLPVVPAAYHSLKRMEGLLVGPLCGWPGERVEVVPNAGQRGDLPGSLMRLFGGITDVAVFYFVGHGQLHDDELCLALAESPEGGPLRKTTGLPFSDVRAALRECEAKTKIVVLDCCFSGIATRPGHSLDAASTDVTDIALGAGEFTMAASTTSQTAWFETSNGVDRPQTYFTKYLIDTIEQGLPGYADGLPLGAVFNRTADALARHDRPVPTRSVWHHADRFIVALNPWHESPSLHLPPHRSRWPRARTRASRTAGGPPGVAGLAVAAGLAGVAVTALAAVILISAQRHPDPSPLHPALAASGSARTASPRPTVTRSQERNDVSYPLPSTAPPRSHSHSRSPSPTLSAYPVNAVSPHDDPSVITASEVVVGYGACSAWLDNDGSGRLSGMVSTGYFMSCGAEVYRSGGPTVGLAASNGGERTSALSDVRHTMWICVWLSGYQAGQQCSPPFGIIGNTPTQN